MDSKSEQLVSLPSAAPQRRPLRLQIIKDIGSFSLGSFISAGGSFFSSYVGAMVLGPQTWGLWEAVKLLLHYGGNLHLGVLNAMHREIPILRGRGAIEQQAQVTNLAASFSLVISGFLSVCLFMSTLVLPGSPQLLLSLRFVSLMLFVLYVNIFFGLVLRAHNKYGIVGRTGIVDALGNLCSAALTVFLGLVGFLTGQLVRLSGVALYSYRKSSCHPHWCWDNRMLGSLVLIGFPIMLLQLSYFAFTTIDRILILSFIDAEALGFYSFGHFVFAPVMMIFSASGSVVYTRAGETYGQSDDPSMLEPYVTIPVERLGYGMSVVVGVLYLALPFFVRVFLPAYMPGLQPARILMFGLFFAAVAVIPGYIMLTVGRQVARLGILAGSFLVNLCCSYAALKLGYGLIGVAVATAFGYFIFFISSTVIAMGYVRSSGRKLVFLLAKVLGAIFYVFVVIVLLGKTFPTESGTAFLLFRQTVLTEVIFMFLCLHLIYLSLSGTTKRWIWSS